MVKAVNCKSCQVQIDVAFQRFGTDSTDHSYLCPACKRKREITVLIKWLLFSSFSLTVPVYWVAFAGAGFVPLFVIVLSTFACGSTFFFFLFINAVNVLFWGSILYGLSAIIAIPLAKLPRIPRVTIFLIVLVALAFLTTLEIYGAGFAGGGSGKQFFNLFDFIFRSRQLW